MLLKVIGAGLVILGSTGVGFFYSNILSERTEALIQVKKIMIMLRGEINYNHSTLSESFSILSNRTKSPFDIFLKETGDKLNEMTGNTMESIWKEMVNKHLKGTSLNQKDLERLSLLGNDLGYLDKKMQLSTLDLYLEQLEQQIGESLADFNKNSRLYKCLGIMGGILINLIII